MWNLEGNLGRLAGHEKSTKDATNNPDNIIRVKETKNCTCGCETVDIGETKRDLINVEVNVRTTQYVGKKKFCPNCGKIHFPKFPKGITKTIQYDSNIKAIMAYLNADCNVSNVKVSEFLKFLTNDKISIAPSTVTAILPQFKTKAKKVLESIKEAILKEAVINEDETPISVNGKFMSAIGCFTKKFSLIDSFKNRRLESFEEMGILNRYIGTVCHDHNSIHKSFAQSQNAECNFHVLRYCKAEYEKNKREVIKDFMDYLLLLRDRVSERKLDGKTKIEDDEYVAITKEYLTILDKWDKEYKDEIGKLKYEEALKYHTEERCLKDRLREDIDDHLRFLKDFRIDFTNNLAERGLRPAKTKLKVIGGFRNLRYSKCYFAILSIIQTYL